MGSVPRCAKAHDAPDGHRVYQRCYRKDAADGTTVGETLLTVLGAGLDDTATKIVVVVLAIYFILVLLLGNNEP
jgi:hypothetical protein